MVIMLLSGTAAWAAGEFGYPFFQRAPEEYVYRTDRVFEGDGGGFNPVSTMRRERMALRAGAQGKDPVPALGGEPSLGELVKEMSDRLLESVGRSGEERVVALSTFVNLNNLYKTSSLGRFLSEQLMGELQRAGMRVVEVRKTPGMMISQGYGEYSLSRDMAELRYVHQVDGVVVGTYSFGAARLYLNVRLLDGEDGMVLGSASMESPMGPTIAQFLADEAMPVPVGRPVAVRELHD